MFETTSLEFLAKHYHPLHKAPVVALSHSQHEEKLVPVHWKNTRTSWTCMCWDTAEKLRCDIHFTDMARLCPSSRLTDFLSGELGHKEREQKMFGFPHRHKPWLQSACLCLGNAEVVLGSNTTALCCLLQNLPKTCLDFKTNCPGKAWYLALIIWPSLRVKNVTFGNMGREGSQDNNTSGLVSVF